MSTTKGTTGLGDCHRMVGAVRGGVGASARRVRALVVGVVIASVPVVIATAPSQVAAGGPAAVFDYSMPSRYGMDGDADGVIDSYVPTTTCTGETASTCTNHPATSAFPVEPATWHVDLDACGSDGDIYEWSVLAHPGVQVQQAAGGGCDDFYAEFPAEGTYKVGLRARHSFSVLFGDWYWMDVVVQDWLIISMGDSYGAGEGSPDVPIDPATLPDVAEAFAGLGDALKELGDFGPCAGTAFDFDDCVIVLDAAGNDAVAAGAEFISQLNDPVCDITDFEEPGFDLLACLALLANLAITGIDQTIDAVGQAVEDAYDTYSSRFQDVYDAAAAVVDSFETLIENFERGAVWQDRRCHRSANAGASLAAKELEDLDKHTSVTLVHVACTGAMILQGVIDTYKGAEDERESRALPEIPPQVHQAAALIGDREIDVVNFSIGGNDVNFGPMIFSCVLRVDCSRPNTLDDPEEAAAAAADSICPASDIPGVSLLVRPIFSTLCRDFFESLGGDPLMGKDAAELFRLGVEGDPTDVLRPGIVNAYGQLDAALYRQPFSGPGTPDTPSESGLGLPAGRNDRVYITEYVNPLLRHDGGVCNQENDGLNMIPGVTLVETTFLDSVTVDALTDVVRSGAEAHQWNFISGIVEGFESASGEGHGYCADPNGGALPTDFGPPAAQGRWMVRLQEAFLSQGNKMGGVHPNRSGYRQYANQILPAWLADLYADPVGLSGPRRPDQLPFADAGDDRTLDEGDVVTLVNDSYDGEGDPIRYGWSTTDPSVVTVDPSDSSAPDLEALDDGSAVVQLVVDDDDEGVAADSASITVRNVAPTVSDSTAEVDEGSIYTADLGFTDPGTLDTHRATIDHGDGSAQVSLATVTGGVVPLSHGYVDDGSFSIDVTVTDDDLGADTGTVAVTVHNAAPVVGAVAAPIAPVLIGTTIGVSAPFTDAGVDDVHTAVVDWGDGATTPAAVTQGAGSGSVSASSSYSSPGIYTVTVRVTDDDGGTGSAQFLYVVVYDPAGGFVTGGGLIESPIGAYAPDPSVAGSAQFAFISKYQKGATTPQGTTSFRFHAADFEFASTSYEWLVVSGAKATYKGRGTINGAGDFGFLLSTVDGDAQTVPGPDRLRLKVWDRATGTVVYDNQPGAADDATATTAVAAGAITVSAPKKK